MKVLIVYPNLPMMITPATSVAIFTSILKSKDCTVDIFETTLYSDHENAGMLYKSKLGGGRGYSLSDLGMDLQPTNMIVDDFVDKVSTFNPDLLLFSTVEDTLGDTLLLLDSIVHLSIPHIVGGVLPINDPHFCLSHSQIDTICRFEGELVLSTVIDNFEDNWKDTDGLWYKKDGSIVKNDNQPLVNINDILPDYSLYNPVRFNRPIGGKVRPTIQFETYRGCPYSCTFCNSPTTRYLDKNYLRRKTMSQVKQEIQHYVDNFNPEYLFIIDDSFLARPKKEIIELCNILHEFKLPWWCNTRLENVDKEILAAMEHGYCDRIQFGIECGSEDYRREVLLRNVSNDLYYEKADILNNSSIPYGLNVIIGLPDETREMVFETVDLVRSIQGYDGIGVSIFIPYRGTLLRQYAVDKGYLPSTFTSGSGYLLGGSPLVMPKPYLQRDEINDLSKKFKLYSYFDKMYWDDITEAIDTSYFDDIYENNFYTKYAISGELHKKRRKQSPWACAASDSVDIHNLFALSSI